jgi:predicted RNA-binding protein YlqC (UPF0109 family)
MKDLVEYIAKSLVDHPESVHVNEIDSASAIIIELQVADSDMGRVIGKGGRVVNAIRTVAQVAADKEGKRITLEILD